MKSKLFNPWTLAQLCYFGHFNHDCLRKRLLSPDKTTAKTCTITSRLAITSTCRSFWINKIGCCAYLPRSLYCFLICGNLFFWDINIYMTKKTFSVLIVFLTTIAHQNYGLFFFSRHYSQRGRPEVGNRQALHVFIQPPDLSYMVLKIVVTSLLHLHINWFPAGT